MLKAADVSMIILVKTGKNASVAIDTLAKIATALECGLDDTAGITSDAINS